MIHKDAAWLITGCSNGLGRALAQAALTKGYRVAATARRRADLADLLDAHGDAALDLELDVTDRAKVKGAVAETEAEARFGTYGRAGEQRRLRVPRRPSSRARIMASPKSHAQLFFIDHSKSWRTRHDSNV